MQGVHYCLGRFKSALEDVADFWGIEMPDAQSKFVHWQNLEYEAWYQITGRKTELVPGSFHTRKNSQYEKENITVVESQFEVVDSTCI